MIFIALILISRRLTTFINTFIIISNSGVSQIIVNMLTDGQLLHVVYRSLKTSVHLRSIIDQSDPIVYCRITIRIIEGFSYATFTITSVLYLQISQQLIINKCAFLIVFVLYLPVKKLFRFHKAAGSN